MIGINPRPFTLRRLEWMVNGRMKHLYDVAIAQICYFDQLYGKSFDPKTANPYRASYEFDRIKPDIVKKDDTQAAFKLLGKGLRQFVKKKRKPGE